MKNENNGATYIETVLREKDLITGGKNAQDVMKRLRDRMQIKRRIETASSEETIEDAKETK